MKYTLSRNFKNSGPFEISQLVQMANKGEIQDGNGWYICGEGQKNWVEISKIPEIKSVFAAQAKPKNVPPPVNNSFKRKK